MGNCVTAGHFLFLNIQSINTETSLNIMYTPLNPWNIL